MMEAPRCDPDQVTALVDGALDPAARPAVEAHLAGCATCQDQASFERGIRERLRALPSPEPSRGFEDRLRARIRKSSRPVAPMWLGLAAGLVAGLLWARGSPAFLGWQLAKDHAHCFGSAQLPAQVWTNDPVTLSQWYRDRGTQLPTLPTALRGLELVGGRYCPLMDRKVAHVYYAGDDRHLSLYVVPGYVRLGAAHESAYRGKEVQMLRTAGVVVGLVSEDDEAVDSFRRSFATTLALQVLMPGPAPWPATSARPR